MSWKKCAFRSVFFWIISFHWVVSPHQVVYASNGATTTSGEKDAKPYSGLSGVCNNNADPNPSPIATGTPSLAGHDEEGEFLNQDACRRKYCADFKEDSNRYRCEADLCASHKDEIDRKDCRMNYAAMESQSALSRTDSEVKLNYLSGIVQIANYLRTGVSLILTVIQAVFSKIHKDFATKCAAISNIVVSAAAILKIALDVARLIYNFVATKKLVDKYNNDVALFGLIKPKSGANEEAGQTPMELQRKYFEYFIDQNKVKITASRIEVASHWTYAALIFAAMGVAIGEQVILVSGQDTTRRTICDLSTSTPSTSSLQNQDSDKFIVAAVTYLISFFNTAFASNSSTDTDSTMAKNSDLFGFTGFVRKPIENDDSRKAKSMLVDLLHVGSIAVSSISFIVKLVMLIKDIFNNWKTPTAKGQVGKMLIFPIIRIVLFAAEGALTTALAIISTMQMILLQKRQKALEQIVDRFDQASQNSTKIKLGPSTTQMLNQMDSDKKISWKELIDLVPESIAAEVSSSAGREMREIKLCVNKNQEYDLECKCRATQSCLRFTNVGMPSVIGNDPNIVKALRLGNSLLNGEKSIMDVDVPEVQKLALDNEKLVKNLHRANNKIDKKTGKSIFPSWEEIIEKSKNFLKGLKISEDDVNSFQNIQNSFSVEGVFSAGLKNSKNEGTEQFLTGLDSTVEQVTSSKTEAKKAKKDFAEIIEEEKGIEKSQTLKTSMEKKISGKELNQYKLIESSDIHLSPDDIWKTVSKAYGRQDLNN